MFVDPSLQSAPMTALLAVLLAMSVPAQTFTAGGLHADVYGQPVRGRVFVFHTLDGYRSQNTGTPPNSTLVAAGYQVISTDEPYDRASPDQGTALRAALRSDGTAGQTYRDRWARQTRALIEAADRRFGRAPRLIMAGMSWGGYSALLAACTNPEVDAYAVHIPVVDPSALTELKGIQLRNLQLWTQGCDKHLAAMPGYISWGITDTRVGTVAVRRLLSRLRGLHAPVVSRAYPTGHDITPLAVSGLAQWISRVRPGASRAARRCASPSSPPGCPKSRPPACKRPRRGS